MDNLKEIIFPKQPPTEKRFFIFFLWTSLVPLILLFLAGYYTTIVLLEKQAIEKQTALAGQKHSELALFVEKIQSNTASWGTDGRIRELMQRINDGECSRTKEQTTCPIALELSNYLSNNKLPLLHAVGLIDILNIDGIIVASSDTTRIGIDERGEQIISFDEALLLPFGQATFFPKIITEEGELGGSTMVHLTTPITSINSKKLIGVLLAHTISDELNKVVAENRGQTTESYLVNEDMIMVTPSRFIPDAVFKQKAKTPPVRECVERGISFHGSYVDYRGVEVFGASVCDPKLFGTLIVETDKSEVFVEINRLLNTASAILVVVLILILGYAYLSGADIVGGARHIFPNTIPSAITLSIVLGIIVIATLGISFVFTKNIEKFIIDQKIDVISSLLSQQAERHINSSSASVFNTWETPESQNKFQDFSEEILYSFQSVVAVQLHTISGVLIWSSLQKAEVGTSPEKAEVDETLQTGKISRSSASASTISELGVSTLIGVYVPVLGQNGDIAGVAEVYLNTNDIAVFTSSIQTVLWVGSFASLVLIFLLLRYVLRKQDAKIIEQSEELSSVIEESPIGIYTIDQTGVITSVNPKMMELLLEDDQAKIIGRNIFDIKRIQRLGIYEDIKGALSGTPFRKEVTATEPNGEILYRYYQGAPLFGENKTTVEHVLFIVEDITERKKLEEEVRGYTKGLEEKVEARTKDITEAKAKAEALLASLGEGMIATDNTGVIITMNSEAEKMLGWNRDEVIGRKMTDMVPAVNESNVAIPPEQRICLITATAKTVETLIGTMYFIKKDGDKVPVAVTATPVIINNENTGAVVIFRDITAENEIEKTRRDLLSLASHQLRTPLSGTKWLIETLKKGIHGTLTKNQEEYLNEIYKINEQMTILVHDMLSVLRMEGDVTKAKKEQVSLTKLFDVIFESLGGVARSKHVNLKLNRGDEDTIDTDPILLRNVLESIISNAVNYSPDGSEVIITVEKNPEEVVFAIKDFGIGIPKDEQRQVFERFYRASNAKTYDTHGTGLGLYIAATLAKKLGASISFESEKDKGSTFFVHVPYVI